MYVVSLNTEKRIVDVYDTEQLVDDGVETFPLSEQAFQQVWASGRNGDWVYQNGAVSYAPLPEPEPYSPPVNAGLPSGTMPQSIL